MDRVRYIVALLLVVTGPAVALFWLPVHSLARVWRRIGYRWAYAAGFGVMGLAAAIVFAFRHSLLAVEFGTHPVPVVAGAILMVASAALRRRWRQQLSLRALVGLPELSPAHYPGTLLTQGVYARVRHPRYLEALVGFLGLALLSNYLAAYGVCLFLLLSFVAVLIPLEERELVERFGRPYEDYRRRVPALVPRLRQRAQEG